MKTMVTIKTPIGRWIFTLLPKSMGMYESLIFPKKIHASLVTKLILRSSSSALDEILGIFNIHKTSRPKLLPYESYSVVTTYPRA